MADYTATMQEIKAVFLDHRTSVEDYKEDHDEDGHHCSYSVGCTKQQENEVEELLRQFLLKEMQILVSNIFATEDAKRIHYE